MNRKALIASLSLAMLYLPACYKKDIQFATGLGETYINLSSVDTVAVGMSTVLLDSFATNNPSSLLIGSYKDAYLGLITAKPFFQLSLPSDLTIEDNAVYDSLTFILKPNGSYYGDTTKSFTLGVYELDQNISYTYGTQLFNNSTVAAKPVPLGTKTVRISPAKDSISVRLSDAKGAELFDKLKTASADVSSTGFLNYFKGIMLSVNRSDTSMVYGANVVTDSVKMRLHYHTSVPYPESRFKDFSISRNDLAFNQLIADRSGTLIQSSGAGIKEFASTVTGDRSYLQSGAGVLLKLTFPTLRNILQLSSTVKLVDARLVVRVAENSFDAYNYKLPASLYLAGTDASNSIGSAVAGVAASVPQTDYVYNTNATYSFSVTSAINTLLTTAGTTANGFFLLENSPGNLAVMNRLVANDAHHGSLSSQLILYVVTVKNN